MRIYSEKRDEKVKLGNIEIKGFVSLAPMAGVADKSVREISRRYGANYTVGEMTSAKGLVMESDKSNELLSPDDAHPHGVQIFGAEPSSMEKAAGMAAALGVDIIDINMGCPAPKVTKNGAGSALLGDILLAEKVIRATVRGAGDTPVTVKIRKGYNDDDVAVEFSKMIESAGAQMITIHARTRNQMYTPPIDIDCITRVKNVVTIPVVGNGDIFCWQDAVNMFERTGCDMVMVGRGALGNPWLFDQINCAMNGIEVPQLPPLEKRLDVLQEEILLLIDDKGEHTGFREARRHTSWYMTGLRGAAHLRKLCGEINNIQDIKHICKMALDTNPEID